MGTGMTPKGEGASSAVDEQDAARSEDNGGAVLDLDRGELTISLPAQQRTIPLSQEPTFWWEWLCPVCGQVCKDENQPCPVDGHPPKRTCMSMPFLWLG